MLFKFPCKINSLNFAQYIIIVVKLRLTALFHTLLLRLPYFLIMMTLNMVHSHGKKVLPSILFLGSIYMNNKLLLLI